MAIPWVRQADLLADLPKVGRCVLDSYLVHLKRSFAPVLVVISRTSRVVSAPSRLIACAGHFQVTVFLDAVYSGHYANHYQTDNYCDYRKHADHDHWYVN